MAALFYTNHRINDVTLLFYMWRDAALKKMGLDNNLKKQQKGLVPPAIEIDVELANEEVF